MTETPTYDRKAGNPDDRERTPTHDVKDVRTTGTVGDRSGHRDHTWLYEDLLA